jgi:predicted lipoprotein with Yx(FWY)xxD motif
MQLRTIVLFSILAALLVLCGGLYLLFGSGALSLGSGSGTLKLQQAIVPGMPGYESNVATGPSGTAGINGGAGQTNTGQVAAKMLIKVGDSKLGKIIVDGEAGLALYTDADDGFNSSNCTGQCAGAWPPLIVAANEPLLGAVGLTGILGTVQRDDGSTQLTYNGKPLYFYKNDSKPGDTTGNGVNKVWAVARP